jgi:hypothetical protein
MVPMSMRIGPGFDERSLGNRFVDRSVPAIESYQNEDTAYNAASRCGNGSRGFRGTARPLRGFSPRVGGATQFFYAYLANPRHGS